MKSGHLILCHSVHCVVERICPLPVSKLVSHRDDLTEFILKCLYKGFEAEVCC